MYANYHTHTFRCQHATGKPEDYVLTGIERGLKVLGFSDHVPIPFSKKGYVSRCRMTPQETESYVNELLELREKYKNDITLYIGYEAEYMPREFEGMMKLLNQYPLDYLILGQHFTKNEYDGSGTMGLRDYPHLVELVDTYITAMDTGVYSYIAHPDLLPYTEDPAKYEEQMTRLIEYAIKTDTPLEYNMLGMETGRFYPYAGFWKLAARLGASVVIGCDAHQPERVADPVQVDRARRELAAYGITPMESIPFKKPTL